MNYRFIVQIGMVLSLTMPMTVEAMSLAHMSVEQKHAAQAFFRAHALDFSHGYGLYHPGPYWILREPSLKLTVLQQRQETALKLAMARATLKDSLRVKWADKRYDQLSRQANPNLQQLHMALSAAGVARVVLGWEMIPFHVRAYQLLTPIQKVRYKQLVALRVRAAHRTVGVVQQ